MKALRFLAGTVLCGLLVLACGGEDPRPSAPVCGNGRVEPGEACDDGNQDDTDGCLSTCVEARCGDGVVHAGVEACDLGADNSDSGACTTSCREAVCGDGLVYEGHEGCDDGNDDETDGCLSTCVLASCGDGEVQEGEACDDGNDDETDACLSNCLPARCGDGHVYAGVETCDDGNDRDDDACPTTCEPARCGDGFVLPGVEACDLGAENADTGACTTSCKEAVCGDGLVHAGVEACDLGAANSDTGACTTACREATCGDGLVHEGVEECDLGEGNAEDAACLPGCVENVCGDGFVEAGVEACDEGAENRDDGACLTTCEVATCGDGKLHVGVEACDDGNLDDDDACPSTCQPARCGDGFVQAGVEGCDRGSANSDEPDALCRTDCQPRRCGDGIRDTGEQCDDGGTAPGDGCSPDCFVEGDSCNSPLPLPSLAMPFTISGDTRGFGSDIDLDFCTQATATNRDVVYSLTSPIDARWEFALTPDADFDIVLGVLSSCFDVPASGSELGCADSPAEGGTEHLTIDLVANQTVYLVIDGYDDPDGLPDEGTWELTATPTPIVGAGQSCAGAVCAVPLVCNPNTQICVPNVCGDGAIGLNENCDDGNTTTGDGCDANCRLEGDHCSNVGVIPVQSDGRAVIAGSTVGLGTDYNAGCPVEGQSNYNGDVIFAFTSPTDAKWTFDITADFNSVLAIQTSCGDNTTNLACDNRMITRGGDSVSAILGAGETVFILVDGYGNSTYNEGSFVLVGTQEPVVPAGASCAGGEPCEPGSFCYALGGVCVGTCGNGAVDADSRETCDDGNTAGGDGCSANCVRAPGWSCPVPGAACRPIVCGDGHVDPPESCDDGGAVGGDGCDANCQFEPQPLPEAGSELVLQGAFTVDDPAWQQPNTTCGATTGTPRRYDTWAVINDGPAPKTIDIEMNYFGTSMYLHVFGLPWNPERPTENCITGSLASQPARTGIVVGPGETRLIVVTDYSETLRPYTIRVKNPPVCGDGLWGNAEACDDGNGVQGDGCDSCQVEPGYTCSHVTATCFVNDCGDGMVGNGEACDDGNGVDDDDCSNACLVRGDTCGDAAVVRVDPATQSFRVTGDTRTASADYDLDCNFARTVANGDRVYEFTAPVSGIWTFDATADTASFNIALGVQRVCGDATRNLACDVSSTTTWRRSATLEMLAGETVYLVVDGYGTGSSPTSTGQGAFTLTGKVVPYVGLGASCDPAGVLNRCGDGFLCDTSLAAPVCIPTVCGNGVLEPGEECEDGNVADGDGCSPDCRIDAVPLADAGSSVFFQGSIDATDPTWLPPSTTCAATTRNGSWHYDVYYVRNTGAATKTVDIAVTPFVSSAHAFVYDLPFDPAQPLVNCLDVDLRAGPRIEKVELRAGEARAIVVGTGLETAPTPGAYELRVTTLPVCGDGLWGDAEGCDDGNPFDWDGCSSTCQVEPGWTCSRTTGTCFANFCGDGIAGNGEACDDGNADETDACNSACAWNGDTCAAPVILTASAANPAISVEGNTTGMARDYTASCANTSTSGDVFYQFVAPFHGFWRFSVRGELTMDTAIAVMSDCGVPATELACAEDGGDGAPDTVRVELAAGQLVYVVVDGYGTTGSNFNDGAYRLDVFGAPVKHLGETCDPAGVTSVCAVGTLCDADTGVCVGSVCGNGLIESGEECDDGNVADGDGCSATCLVPSIPLLEAGSALRFDDALVGTDAKWAPPNTSCTAATRSGDWHYDAWVVRNTGPVEKRVDVSLTKMPVTTFVFVYDLPFDPADQLTNCAQGASGLEPAINDLVFAPGEAKVLLVSTGATTNRTPGPYTLVVATEAVCGDGIWGNNEACDGGVGCSPSCMPEPGYSCRHGVGCALNVCGDGVVGDWEECDDGNLVDDDACSNGCMLLGADCSAPGVIRTTAADPGFVIHASTVGGGTDYAAGCATTTGSSDRVYEFTTPVGGTWTFNLRGHDFDGALAVTATCGVPLSELGCSELGLFGAVDTVTLDLEAGRTVFLEVDGFSSTSATNQGRFTLTGAVVPFKALGEPCNPNGVGGACAPGTSCDDTLPAPVCSLPVCGNGRLEPGEGCDDGGTAPGDGCAADCRIEGIGCELPRVAVAGPDNTFTLAGDTTGLEKRYAIGCEYTDNSPDMHIAFTAPVAGRWTFTVTPDGFDAGLAVTTICGDPRGQIACVEAGGSGAADTVTVALAANETVYIVVDGFSSSTTVNDGPFVLTGELTKPFRQIGEGCDPSGAADECVAGAVCDLLSSMCVATVCGNGIPQPEGGEACDDGNTDDWDGCSNDCQIRGDSCAAPFDLRRSDTDPAPNLVRVTGNLFQFKNDHTPACYSEMTATTDHRDVVYELHGNGVTDEAWTLTLSGATTTDIILEVDSACVPRNARLFCAPNINSNNPGSYTFILGADETVYIWIDSEAAVTANRGYTLTGAFFPLGDAGASCDPLQVGPQCAKGLTCGPSATCVPAVCGDFVVDGEEECDEGPFGSTTCSPDCYVLGDTCNAPYDLNVLSTVPASGAWAHAGDLVGKKPDYIPYCTTAAGYNDVVYVFTAPFAGTYTFSETQSFDAVLYASHECPDTAGTPDLVCTANEFVSLRLEANETIFLFVERSGSTTQGLPTSNTNYALEVSWSP